MNADLLQSLIARCAQLQSDLHALQQAIIALTGDEQTPLEPVMSADDVAGLLRISRDEVIRLAGQGHIPSFRISPQRYGFHASALRRWMAAGGCKPGAVETARRLTDIREKRAG